MYFINRNVKCPNTSSCKITLLKVATFDLNQKKSHERISTQDYESDQLFDANNTVTATIQKKY